MNSVVSGNMGVNRRSLIKGIAVASAGGAGLSALGGVVSAWDPIDTNIDCPECKDLVKLEQQEGEDPEFTVADDGFGVIDEESDYSRNGNTYFIEPDDHDVDARIRITPTEFGDDGEEIQEIDFTSDALICEVRVKDGKPTDPHLYYSDRQLPVIKGNGLYVDDDGGKLRGISNLVFRYCPSLDVTVTNDQIDITRDQARFGIWYGAFHLNDEEVYDQGAKPDRRGMTDSDQIFFSFDSPYTNEFITDPFDIKSPSRMKAELLVDPAVNEGQGYVSEVNIPPGEPNDFIDI